jgi:molecular chaperone DnaJ
MRLLIVAVALLSLACVDARDKYEVLGIYGSATKQQIRAKYRELSKKYHPDTLRGLGEEEVAKANTEFEEITAAFRVLIDPAKRKRYDEFGDERGGDEGTKKFVAEPDDFEYSLSSYAAIIWLVVVGGLAFVVKDDPKQKSSSKKGRKGKKGGFFDDITGLWTSFLNSGNKTKLFAIAVVGCILISIFTMDADDLSGPRVKSQDELDYEYNLKHAYDDLQNGKQHRALKAFNLATDLEFGKTQPAPYIEMSKILIDMDQASNSEPLLAHAFSLLPEVKALKDRAGTENYMQQAFIANYDVSDEGAAMSDTDDFKELKKEYHESAGQILDASIKHFSKKKFKNEQLVEKLVEFKKGIFDNIEDNSGDASQGDTEFDEDDQDDHLDSKPDFDKMVDDEDEDEE